MSLITTVRREVSKRNKELDLRVVAILWLMIAGICVALANALAAGLA